MTPQNVSKQKGPIFDRENKYHEIGGAYYFWWYLAGKLQNTVPSRSTELSELFMRYKVVGEILLFERALPGHVYSEKLHDGAMNR